MIKKKKLLLICFFLIITFSLLISHVSAEKIDDNPAKYFNKVKVKNSKNPYFLYKPFKKTNTYIGKVDIKNTSSGVNYYYNKSSNFKQIMPVYYTYNSEIKLKTKKMAKTKTYSNGKYKLTIKTIKNSKGKFKYLKLKKIVQKNEYYIIKNPYFSNSEYLNWRNSHITKIANIIKKNITSYNYKDKNVYNTELANAVIRYLWLNIKYDDNYSNDQSAITTLKRKSGTCLGKSMLAGALLRAVGIPTYFESSYPKTGKGHIWPVSYIFYNNKYQWVRAETTYYYSDTEDRYYYSIIGNLQKENELYKKGIDTLNSQIEINNQEISFLNSLINYNNISATEYYTIINKEYSSNCLIEINITNLIYLSKYFKLKYPFQKDSLNWWIIGENGIYDYSKTFT